VLKKLRFIIVILLLLLMAVPISGQTNKKKSKVKKQIAITFDELPAARTFGDVDLKAISYLLLDALKQHDVKATGFVVGEQIENAFDILGQWLNNGHKLGNLTYSGQDYNRISPQQFIRDIKNGADALEPMLSGFGQKKRYFRFPYLHYGDEVEKRKAVTDYIEDNNYIVCPATVIPEDYLYNLTLVKLGKEPDSTEFEQLLNDYINHVLDELERQERIAKTMLNRSIPHILLLRANRLNAVYLDELLTALEDMDYEFVNLDKVIKNKVYKTSEAYYGLKGLSYLEMIQNSDPDHLPAE